MFEAALLVVVGRLLVLVRRLGKSDIQDMVVVVMMIGKCC